MTHENSPQAYHVHDKQAAEPSEDEVRVEALERDLLLAAQQNTRLSERLDRAEARDVQKATDLVNAGLHARDLRARIERLEGALREIAEWRGGHASAISRAALAEEPHAERPGHQHLGEAWGPCSECGQPVYHEVHTKWQFEEPYADVPGAGQRGCG